MSDLISREAAIEALEKEKPTPFVNEDGSIDPFGAGRQNQWYRDGIAIMNLPSAQQWIPVSERLPEEKKQVLVCDGAGFIYTAECETLSDGEGRWFESVEYRSMDDVMAWMSLPEPWKGVTE